MQQSFYIFSQNSLQQRCVDLHCSESDLCEDGKEAASRLETPQASAKKWPKRTGEYAFVRASDLARLEQQSVRLSTGYARLDTVLGGGGVRLRQVTVLVNNAQHFQQVAHTLCANALRTNQQEPERNAIYIDQLGFFNIQKVLKTASADGSVQQLPRESLANLLYARAYNEGSLFQLLEKLCTKLEKEDFKASLVLLDLAKAFFSTTNQPQLEETTAVDQNNISPYVQQMSHYLHRLEKLASSAAFAVVVFVPQQNAQQSTGAEVPLQRLSAVRCLPLLTQTPRNSLDTLAVRDNSFSATASKQRVRNESSAAIQKQNHSLENLADEYSNTCSLITFPPLTVVELMPNSCSQYSSDFIIRKI